MNVVTKEAGPGVQDDAGQPLSGLRLSPGVLEGLGVSEGRGWPGRALSSLLVPDPVALPLALFHSQAELLGGDGAVVRGLGRQGRVRGARAFSRRRTCKDLCCFLAPGAQGKGGGPGPEQAEQSPREQALGRDSKIG